MPENFIDKAIKFVDPVRAARRFQARTMLAVAGGYVAGSRSRRTLSTFTPIDSSADAALLPDLPLIRERSRDLVRNSPLAGGAIETVCTSVVGPGLKLKSSIDRNFLGLSDDAAEAWENDAEFLWNMWADSTECDTTRKQNFHGLSDLVLRSTLENGDVFSMLPFIERAGSPFGLKVTLIEADRVCNSGWKQDTNELAGGVQLDSFGAPTAYHILKTHPGSVSRKAREWQVIPAFGADTGRRNVLHIFTPLRVEQNRGMPYLAPVVEYLKMISDYTEAELTAAVVSGMFTVFIKNKDGDANLGPMEPTSEVGGSTSDKDIKLGNGAVIGLAQGEEVDTANPGRPNTAFEGFVRAVAEQVGVRLELPYELLVKHFQASYSASRAALLEAWRFFKKKRVWVAGSFNQPVYEEFLMECVARGLLRAPGFIEDPFIRRAYCLALWSGIPMGHVQPAQEANAAKTRIETGITNLEQEIADYNGGDWEDTHAQSVREKKARQIGGLDKEAVIQTTDVTTDDIADEDGGGENVDGDSVDNQAIRDDIDSYGIAVRAGVITPQPEDEDSFRKRAKLPPASKAVRDAWESDGRVRRPITIQEVKETRPDAAKVQDNVKEDGQQ